MSNRSPFEEYAKRFRQAAASGGRGGFPAGGGFPGGAPKGLGGGLVGLLLLGGGAWFFQNALFNVDGGHRAIKYRRLSGVSKDIYSEGTPPVNPADSVDSVGAIVLGVKEGEGGWIGQNTAGRRGANEDTGSG